MIWEYLEQLSDIIIEWIENNYKIILMIIGIAIVIVFVSIMGIK